MQETEIITLINHIKFDEQFKSQLLNFIKNENDYKVTIDEVLSKSTIISSNCNKISEIFITFYTKSLVTHSDKEKEETYNLFFNCVIEKLAEAFEFMFYERDLPKNQNFEGFQSFQINMALYITNVDKIINSVEASSLPQTAVPFLKDVRIIDTSNNDKPLSKGMVALIIFLAIIIINLILN